MTPEISFAPMPALQFAREVAGLGRIGLRPIRIPQDIARLHDWVTRDYARFWGMQHVSLADLETFYREMDRSPHDQGYLGFHDGTPAFLMEAYDPQHDRIGACYPVEPGDRGMHFLVAPAERPVHGFTLEVLRTIVAFLFEDEATRRIVVEPDERNDKIHVLNRRVGFVYHGKIELSNKVADLAFCERQNFQQSLA